MKEKYITSIHEVSGGWACEYENVICIMCFLFAGVLHMSCVLVGVRVCICTCAFARVHACKFCVCTSVCTCVRLPARRHGNIDFALSTFSQEWSSTYKRSSVQKRTGMQNCTSKILQKKKYPYEKSTCLSKWCFYRVHSRQRADIAFHHQAK